MYVYIYMYIYIYIYIYIDLFTLIRLGSFGNPLEHQDSVEMSFRYCF